MKKKILLVLALALSLMLVACGGDNKKAEAPKEPEKKQEAPKEEAKPAAPAAKGAFPVKITTYNFAKEPVELEFKKAPEKVVAIYQSPIETLLALGQGDKIVFAAFLDDPVLPEYEAEFKKIKHYQSKAPTKEDIMALEPDLITSWTSLFSEKNMGDVKFWHDRGTNTYIQQNSGIKKPNTLENEYEDIINMGKIFGVEEKAVAIVDNMKAEIAKAKKSQEGKTPVKCLILEAQKDGVFRIYGKDSIGGQIAVQVGAELVIAENSKVSAEDIIAANPDVIFTVYYGDTIVAGNAVESIVKNDKFGSLAAVKNAKVFPIVLSEVYATGVRTLLGIKTIATGLYGK